MISMSILAEAVDRKFRNWRVFGKKWMKLSANSGFEKNAV